MFRSFISCNFECTKEAKWYLVFHDDYVDMNADIQFYTIYCTEGFKINCGIGRRYISSLISIVQFYVYNKALKVKQNYVIVNKEYTEKERKDKTNRIKRQTLKKICKK